MIKRIIVNKHVIRSNKRTGEREAPLSVQTYKKKHYGHEVTLKGTSKVVYSPDQPLSCGATAWIETTGSVIVWDHDLDEAIWVG